MSNQIIKKKIFRKAQIFFFFLSEIKLTINKTEDICDPQWTSLADGDDDDDDVLLRQI